MLSRKLVVAAATLAAGVVPAAATAHGSQTHSGRATAQQQCRAELTSMGQTTFRATYGSGKRGANAFGRCVSHRNHQDAADTSTAQQNAAQACRAEQSSDPAAFQTKYGTNRNGRNAFGKCVSQHTTEQSSQEQSQQTQAEDNAAQACRTEQSSDPAAFQSKYGTNGNGRNAFGKCVSSKAKQQEQQSGSDQSGGSQGSSGSDQSDTSASSGGTD